MLTAENVDWTEKVLSYQRLKTKEWCSLGIGPTLERLLKRLPEKGPFFPTLREASASDRSAEFYRRRRLGKIEGVSLHSYRYLRKLYQRSRTSNASVGAVRAADLRPQNSIHALSRFVKALLFIPTRLRLMLDDPDSLGVQMFGLRLV